jgi:hypothetical protein
VGPGETNGYFIFHIPSLSGGVHDKTAENELFEKITSSFGNRVRHIYTKADVPSYNIVEHINKP